MNNTRVLKQKYFMILYFKYEEYEEKIVVEQKS